MALSMDEQRMLAEIERRLSAEDPRLAARLSSFRRPGPAARLRSPRGRIIGSLFTIALVAVISMMVYAMVPFRAHGPKTSSSPQASSPGVSASAPAQIGPQHTAAKANTPAKTTATSTSTNSTRTSRAPAATRTGAGKTGTTGTTSTAGTTASHSSAGSAKTTGGT